MTDEQLPTPDSSEMVAHKWHVQRWKLSNGLSLERVTTDIRPQIRYAISDSDGDNKYGFSIMREVFLLFLKLDGKIPADTKCWES